MGTTAGVVVEAPVAGTIVRHVRNNDELVQVGQVIAILESMKMELEVAATASGTLTHLARVGEQVAARQPMARVAAKVRS
jgi:oxaloacetate decarboxylase alpha subunit